MTSCFNCLLCIRKREKLGAVRVSKAYEFYCALKECSKSPQERTKRGDMTTKSRRPKPPFEATSYLTLYAACDMTDAIGKVDCHIILNREEEMWDCSKISGSSGCYEFMGMREKFEDDKRCLLRVRFLPCCCNYCSNCMYEDNRGMVEPLSQQHIGENFNGHVDDAMDDEGSDSDVEEDMNDFEPCDGQCVNMHIVGALSVREIKIKNKVVAPTELSEPLMRYDAQVLKAFIKSKQMKGRHSNKTDMCNLIRSFYAQINNDRNT